MWLSKEYEQLKALSAKLKGKAEYGVQVFFENDFVDRNLKDSQEIQNLEEQLKNASSGVAYLLNKNLKKRRQIERHLVLDKYARALLRTLPLFSPENSSRRNYSRRGKG